MTNYNLSFVCTKCGKEFSQLLSDLKSVTYHCNNCNAKILNIKVVTGYIYVISNPSMPNLLKIGYTTRNVKERIAELDSSSGVPEPFCIESVFASSAPELEERRIHAALNEYRLSANREFFKLDTKLAIQSIGSTLSNNPVYCKNPELHINKQSKKLVEITPEERNKIISRIHKLSYCSLYDEALNLVDSLLVNDPNLIVANKLKNDILSKMNN